MKLENETQNWEVLDDANKLITCGKLQMLEEMKEILVGFQESYTRLLVVNGIRDDEEMNTFIKEKASARKKILTNFLDLEVFDKLHELVRKDAQEVKYKFKSLCENNWDIRIADQKELIHELNTDLKSKKKKIIRKYSFNFINYI